ncbi:PadR family transcriptional regulator [uncultured Methanospirillum sp.]|uniref:PadR family transcriptional regulator n=1 Tax=uncultured Methanospirillum sp. TaxID=262503 RepID=UPI0029C664C5|nr:PadR family transcriptional regulator [uncultured Methanospirillum sp.]
MNAQFKKGVLEMCVLVLLGEKDRYGYELVQDISHRFEISEGSIYPLLRRLRDEGNVVTYLQESAEGPARKYYSLTAKGGIIRDELVAEWQEFIVAVNGLVEGVSHAEG